MPREFIEENYLDFSNGSIRRGVCMMHYTFLIRLLVLFLIFPSTAFSNLMVTYDYDGLDRLVKVTRSDGPKVKFDFDVMNDIVSAQVQNSPDLDGDKIANFVDLDDDGDGMPDFWEQLNGFNSLNADDASDDPDEDGLSNIEEYQAGTDPNSHLQGVNIPILPWWALLVFAASFVCIALKQQRIKQARYLSLLVMASSTIGSRSSPLRS